MSPQPGAFPLSERRSVRMIGTLVLPVHPLPSLQPPALDSRRKENSALRGGILRKDQHRASSPVVGSRKWGSAFGLAPCPELSFITEVFPLTINIETYLFAWVYSPSFVHILRTALPVKACGMQGAWPTTQARYKGPTSHRMEEGDPIKTLQNALLPSVAWCINQLRMTLFPFLHKLGHEDVFVPSKFLNEPCVQ